MVVLGPRSLEKERSKAEMIKPSRYKWDLGLKGYGLGRLGLRGAWVERGRREPAAQDLSEGRRGSLAPVVEPLLGVGEVRAAAVATDVFRPGFAQVLGGLVGAVQVVMLQVVLGLWLGWPPGFDLPAVRGLHGQQGTVAVLPGACPLVIE